MTCAPAGRARHGDPCGAAASAAALLLVLVAGTGCSWRGESGGPPPERFLPANASLAVVVPRLRTGQGEAASLTRAVLGFPAAAELAESLGSLRAQLGFDPLDPRVLERAGLDLDRGVGAVFLGREPLLLALPVADGRRLERAAAYLAREKLGAGLRVPVRMGGVSVVTFRAGAEAPPALALALAENTALVAAGPDGPARVAAAAALPAAGSLAQAPAFLEARAALGEGHALFAFSPPGSPALARLPFARDGAALGVSASAARLTLRLALLLGGARAGAWREALGGRGEPGGDLAVVPGDAFFVLRFGGDPSALARTLPPIPARAAAALSRAGLELERDLLALLAPGISASLSLAPTFEVARVSRGGAGSAAGDPFQLVHLTAALAVKDPERAAKALGRLAGAAPRLGLEVTPCEVRGVRGWRIARGPARLGLALEGKRLLVAGGAGRLDALLSRPAGTYAGPSDAARAALRGGGVSGAIDFGQLVASFRALPSSAYGSGPDGFVMRSLADRIVEPASRLLAASLQADAVEGAARIDLVVEARQEAGPETHAGGDHGG